METLSSLPSHPHPHPPTETLNHECRGHIAQFYRDDRYLTGAIGEFIRPGLARDEGVVILCTAGHWKQIYQDEVEVSPAFRIALESKQLRFLDADQALRAVLGPESRPTRGGFRAVVESVYREVAVNYSRVRFYGELVDLLCAQNRLRDAEILEGYWNEFLVERTNCTLLCGYSRKNLSLEAERSRVADLHTHLIPEEGIDAESATDSLFRRVAALEFSVAALGVEKMDQKRELNEAKAHLVHLGKLSVLGELSAGLAHEISNPLTIVCGLVNQVKKFEGVVNHPELSAKVGRIEVAAGRMTKIIRNILGFARQSPLTRKVIPVRDPIRQAVEVVSALFAAQHIRILVADGAEELRCLGDAEMLTQVFVNLFLNARDAIISGGLGEGCLEVRVRLDEKKKIEICVIDNGEGMTASTIAKIFYPFFTTKEIGKGTGLGLSLALGTIRDHGGDIVVRSKPGVGTSFTVMLPPISAAEV